MHRNRLPRLLLLLSIPLTTMLAAEDATALPAFALKALADADANSAAAPAECEAVLALSAAIPPAHEQRYWRLIQAAEDYPRAYRFFSALAAQRPHEAEALACAACATAAYVGWMYEHQLGAFATTDLFRTAEADFAAALALDPDNLCARFGLVLYDSRAPARHDRVQDDLARLQAAVAKHPERAEGQKLLAAATQLAAAAPH
jgi:hypothetical protein